MSTTPPPQGGPDQPLGPGGYPVHPGTPVQQAQGAAAAVAQPSSVRLAVKLMWVGAALSLVGLVVTLLTIDSIKSKLRDSLEKSDPNYSQSDFDALFGATIAITVIVSVASIAVWLWMAWKNGQGRNWARIVATVLGGLSVLSAIVTTAAGTAAGASVAVTLVGVVLSIAIVVLLWRKESSAFFAASSRPQMG